MTDTITRSPTADIKLSGRREAVSIIINSVTTPPTNTVRTLKKINKKDV